LNRENSSRFIFIFPSGIKEQPQLALFNQIEGLFIERPMGAESNNLTRCRSQREPSLCSGIIGQWCCRYLIGAVIETHVFKSSLSLRLSDIFNVNQNRWILADSERAFQAF